MSRGRTAAAILALSFGTGITDAFAFWQLGGISTANMTGTHSAGPRATAGAGGPPLGCGATQPATGAGPGSGGPDGSA